TQASRYAELGDLYLELHQPARACAAFEQALSQDPECASAAKRLMEIEPTADHAERLVKLADAGSGLESFASEAERELLADACALAVLNSKPYLLPAELKPSAPRLPRRARLSTDLGLSRESLQ